MKVSNRFAAKRERARERASAREGNLVERRLESVEGPLRVLQRLHHLFRKLALYLHWYLSGS
jgi:hypothetical protein